MDAVYQGDIPRAKELLYSWLKRNAKGPSLEWLDNKVEVIKTSNQKKDIFLAFSSVARFVGKEKLVLSEKDLEEANEARKNWTPIDLTSDEAGRIFLLLSLPHNYPKFFFEILKQLFETAEVSELRALYLGLPLYPFPEELIPRVTEGFRTNINVVFNAIALNNPYPKEFLNEAAWNQMVLKAVFIGSPLYKIQGLDERANPTLAKILSDFAHERWAAGRVVTPELWRSVGPFIDSRILPDLERVILSDELIQKKAAGLSLAAADYSDAKSLLERHPSIAEKIEHDWLTWEYIGKEWEKMSV